MKTPKQTQGPKQVLQLRVATLSAHEYAGDLGQLGERLLHARRVVALHLLRANVPRQAHRAPATTAAWRSTATSDDDEPLTRFKVPRLKV